jgi:hypothetical protein
LNFASGTGAAINLPLRVMELTVADWLPFKEVTLGTGGPRQTRKFVLVPRHAPEGRMEAAAGDPLELEFRPSQRRPRRRLPPAQPDRRCAVNKSLQR